MLQRLFSTTTTTVTTSTAATASGSTGKQIGYAIRSELNAMNLALICSGPKSPMVSTTYVFPAGPAQEAEGQKGASFLLRHSLFKSNRVFSKLSLTRELEGMGATMYAKSTRDGLLISSRHPYSHAHEVLDILGCAIYEWDLPKHEYKQHLLPDAQVESVMNQSDVMKLLEDLAFGIAFRGSSLSHPLYKSPSVGLEEEEVALGRFLEYCRSNGNHALVSSGMEKDDLYYLQTEGVAFKGPRGKLPIPSVPARANFHSGEERMELEGSDRNYLLIAVPTLQNGVSIQRSLLVNRALNFLLDPSPRVPFGKGNSFISGFAAAPGVSLKSFHAEYSNGGLLGLVLEAPKVIDLRECAKNVLQYLQEGSISKDQLFMAKERALFELHSNWDCLEKRTEYLSRLVLFGENFKNLQTIESITTAEILKAYEDVVKRAIEGKKLTVVAIGGALEKLPYRDDL